MKLESFSSSPGTTSRSISRLEATLIAISATASEVILSSLDARHSMGWGCPPLDSARRILTAPGTRCLRRDNATPDKLLRMAIALGCLSALGRPFPWIAFFNEAYMLLVRRTQSLHFLTLFNWSKLPSVLMTPLKTDVQIYPEYFFHPCFIVQGKQPNQTKPNKPANISTDQHPNTRVSFDPTNQTHLLFILHRFKSNTPRRMTSFFFSF